MKTIIAHVSVKLSTEDLGKTQEEILQDFIKWCRAKNVSNVSCNDTKIHFNTEEISL